MRVRLVGKDEGLTHYVGDTKFELTRLHSGRARLLRKRATPKGKGKEPDPEQLHKLILTECLTGWENLEGEDGKLIPFSEENRIVVLDALPGDVVAEIVEKITSPFASSDDEGDDDEEGGDDLPGKE